MGNLCRTTDGTVTEEKVRQASLRISEQLIRGSGESTDMRIEKSTCENQHSIGENSKNTPRCLQPSTMNPTIIAISRKYLIGKFRLHRSKTRFEGDEPGIA